MDRPVTSKSRGICRYYTTPRGCFAGDDCKFLHGAEEKLTPYDKAKVCRYYAGGHCTRGDKCWFRHVLPKVTLDDERIQFSAETCCICLDKPMVYGLLTDCSHVFCLECIRQWRAPTGKSPDVVSSGTIKCCPLCRTSSRFVTPSAHFFPNSSPRKKETIEAYKASMARVPCKYFEETSRTGKPCCPFGLDCFYRHTNPDGTPHVFRHGAKHSMNVYRMHRLRGASLPSFRADYDDPVEFLQHIFENPINNLHATLNVIRASLPALMERFASSTEPWEHDSGEDGEIVDDINPFELLEDDLVLHDEASALLSSTQGTSDEASSPPQSAPVEPAQGHISPSMRASPFPSTSSSPRPSTPPLRFSSRFNSVLSSRNRETLIIDISDDEDEEGEDESAPQDFNIGSDDPSIEPQDSNILTSVPVPQPASPEQSEVPSDSSGNSQPVETPPSRPQCEHEVDPPFLTDGRGRVVWSSTRNVSGRGTAAELRAPRRSRTGSAPRTARPSSSSTLLITSGRGHAWGGQDTQGGDGKVVRRDERGDSDEGI